MTTLITAVKDTSYKVRIPYPTEGLTRQILHSQAQKIVKCPKLDRGGRGGNIEVSI